LDWGALPAAAVLTMQALERDVAWSVAGGRGAQHAGPRALAWPRPGSVADGLGGHHAGPRARRPGALPAAAVVTMQALERWHGRGDRQLSAHHAGPRARRGRGGGQLGARHGVMTDQDLPAGVKRSSAGMLWTGERCRRPRCSPCRPSSATWPGALPAAAVLSMQALERWHGLDRGASPMAWVVTMQALERDGLERCRRPRWSPCRPSSAGMVEAIASSVLTMQALERGVVEAVVSSVLATA